MDRADHQNNRRMVVLGQVPEQWVVQIDAVVGVTAVNPGTFKRPPVTVDAALGRSAYTMDTVDEELRTVRTFHALVRSSERTQETRIPE